MFAISYMSNLPVNSHLSQDDLLRSRAIDFREKIINILYNDIPLEEQTETFYVDLFKLRIDFYTSIHNPDFLKEYSQILIEESVNLMNFGVSRLASLMQNALDFAAHVALFFGNMPPVLLANPLDTPYFKPWVESSMNTEIGLLLGEYAIENRLPENLQAKIADFLKISYERFGAYSMLMGVWNTTDMQNEIPQYMTNMRIVSRVLKRQHLQHA